MEFQSLRDLFDVIQPLRRKYPVLGSYIKYLNKLENIEKQTAEIDQVKTFLIQNPSIQDRMLNKDIFKPGKGPAIYFENVFKLGNEEIVEHFWTKLIELEHIVFPNGKPELETLEGAAAMSDGRNPMDILEKNPVLKDVINQIKLTAATMGPNDDITNVFQSPEFFNVVKTLKENLLDGKYKLSDITNTINDVLGSINTGEMDDKTKSALDTISETISSVEQGNAPDISKLMNMNLSSELKDFSDSNSNMSGIMNIVENLKLN